MGKRILIAFLAYGVLIGAWSFWMGKIDSVAFLNFPASEISEVAYNRYLLPYWQRTLGPIGYEEYPVIDLLRGERVGVDVVPVYDYPLKKVSDLYLPASIISWGMIGLALQLAYSLSSKLWRKVARGKVGHRGHPGSGPG